MSKINIPEEFEEMISRKKSRARMRRTETNHIKQQRIKRAKNYEYRYPCGYWIRDQKRVSVSTFSTEIEPEHYETYYIFKDDIDQYNYNDEHQLFIWPESVLDATERILKTMNLMTGSDVIKDGVIKILKKIPERQYKVIDTEKSCYVDLPIFPRRVDPGRAKKYLRTLSNKRLRRNNKLKLDSYNRGSYRKTFDLWWELS